MNLLVRQDEGPEGGRTGASFVRRDEVSAVVCLAWVIAVRAGFGIAVQQAVDVEAGVDQSAWCWEGEGILENYGAEFRWELEEAQWRLPKWLF